MKQQQCFMAKLPKKAEQTAKETFEKRTFGDDLPVVNVKKINFFWVKYY